MHLIQSKKTVISSKKTMNHSDSSWQKKLQYIWNYYKLPIVILCILTYIIVYSIYRHISYKDTTLYAALVNVNTGDTLTKQLSDQFMQSQGIDISKHTFRLYSGLYLTDNENSIYHEYTYASRIKILGAIDSEQLDVVLMNKEAFDAFSQNGYLCDLYQLLSSTDTGLYKQLQPYLTNNTEIIEDNSIDSGLNPSVPYQAVTKEYPMGLDLSETDFIQKAGFSERVYLGIIKNSPRKDTSLSYVKYLFSK